ncbi:MAG: hypothetical protein V2A79_09965 [Planctomycetota bacterium]
MVILGIDPGVSGGIAAINGASVEAIKMPLTCQDLRDEILRLADGAAIAFVEDVHSMPDDAAKAAGSFLRNVGHLEMCLCCLGIRMERVKPRKWQQDLSLAAADIGKRPQRAEGEEESAFKTRKKSWAQARSRARTERKNRLKRLASERFPGMKVTLATADALLIADYGMQLKS